MRLKPTYILAWLLIILPVLVFSQNHAPIAINDTGVSLQPNLDRLVKKFIADFVNL